MSGKLKVIVCDIDGVLNLPDARGGFMPGDQDAYLKSDIRWHQDCVDTLRMLVKDAGPNTVIVISSWWRLDYSLLDFMKFFESYHWRGAPVIDLTPDLTAGISGTYSRFLMPGNRGSEALAWLDANRERVESFAIFDDM